MEEGIKKLKRENNKIVEEGIKIIILIKGHKVDFLCLKKCVWFYYENQFISRVFQLILVKLLIVFWGVFFYNDTSKFSPGVFTAELH